MSARRPGRGVPPPSDHEQTDTPLGDRAWRRRQVFVPRLRRRLAFAFAAAIAVTSLVMVAGSYVLLRAAQDRDALEGALAQSRFNLLLAQSLLPADPVEGDFRGLLAALAIRGDFEALIVDGGSTYVSGPQVSRALVSADLVRGVQEGRLVYQAVDMMGAETLVVGGRALDQATELYFFYPQAERLAALARVRNVLIALGIALAALGLATGRWIARSMLRPVGQAGRAAARMAGGDLDVRLPESSDEFGAWAASFNMMADSLQTKIAALEEAQVRERRFVSDVAHELRTPVAALVGEASLIETRLRTLPGGTLPPDSRRALELISVDIGRLHRLIEELLEISRIDAGAAEIEWTETNVVEFLGKMMEVHSFDDVQLQATRDIEGLVMLTDRRLLERILLNLVGNARKHGRPPVEIELGAEREREDGRVWITVTDHGVGIAPADLPHIFDRFYKADPSRSASGGSGLGLAIAWETARLLGGSLSSESGVGDSAGARFTLRLPVRIVADSDTIVTDA